MSYRFSSGEPMPDEIRRILLEEIDSATKRLADPKDKDRDENIHEARKSIKKVRGILRLIEPSIGDRVFQAENSRLRNVGRELSQLRDAKAMMEIYDSLTNETEPKEAVGDDVRSSIRTRLDEHKSETEQKIDIQKTLHAAVSGLETTRERIGKYRIASQGFGAIEPGLRKVYRQGRKAMREACRKPLPENFHEWRKRVKDHWYHFRLLEDINSTFVKTRVDDLKKLETWLGDDHNLVVLRENIQRDRDSFGHAKQVREFLNIVDKHGDELRDKALALGESLYGLKPRQLLKEIAGAHARWPEKREAAAKSSNARLSKSMSGKKSPRRPPQSEAARAKQSVA